MTTSKSILASIANLPIVNVVDEVSEALRTGNVALHAEPGAGKSTGLPLVLLESASPSKKIVMLEPRRLAAVGVANRLAAQLGEPLGQRVGLRMRGQTSVSSNTCLEVVTEGVLTRLLQADPTLDGIALVIFDEFHERSLHADLGLALCLEVQQALRDDLRLLLMSATLDAVQLSLQLADVKQISCPGRQHPVDIRWLGGAKADVSVRVAQALSIALADDHGDVLVFLPGIAEIDRVARLIEPQVDSNAVIYRLHGRADSHVQTAATAPASQQIRRIILSTSIAETSITIDGVRIVIDAGLERRAHMDTSTGAQRLETVTASQASATQRAGRAGRTSSGVCYRLWSETDHARRAVSWQAEILRAELSSLLIELGQWGASDVYALPWLEPPPAASVAIGVNLLTTLGIWKDARLTIHGLAVAKLPVHPRIGHMLLWAANHGAADIACKLAVLLEDGGGKKNRVDLDSVMQHTPSRYQQRRINQLRKLIKESASSTPPGLSIVLAQAYPDWIAQRRAGTDARYILNCGAGAFMSTDDPLAQSPWLTIASMGGSSREARIFLACSLDLDDIRAWSPELLSMQKTLEWDDRQERVIAEQHTKLGSLVIHRQMITDISADEKAQALLVGVRKRGVSCLPWTDECREWQARVQRMATLLSNDSANIDWPCVSDESLNASLEAWLLVWLNGKSSLKSLAQLDLLSILSSMLNYQQTQTLDKMLPVRYTVPSGSKIKLRYAGTDNPVLSVKLQEMFGCIQNPSVANGQITLKVELLSPARRPVQLTNDLINFWSSSYTDVKKDMAGRYPKHDWPDDPLNAKPTAYAKPRKHKPR